MKMIEKEKNEADVVDANIDIWFMQMVVTAFTDVITDHTREREL